MLGNIATDRLTEDADFGKKKIIFSDEAHFDLGRYVKKQNYRIWGTENPHAYIEKPTHPNAYGFWKKRSIVSSVCSLYCEKSKRNWRPHR